MSIDSTTDNGPLFDLSDEPLVALVLLHAIIGNVKSNILHQEDTQRLLIGVAFDMAGLFIEHCEP